MSKGGRAPRKRRRGKKRREGRRDGRPRPRRASENCQETARGGTPLGSSAGMRGARTLGAALSDSAREYHPATSTKEKERGAHARAAQAAFRSAGGEDRGCPAPATGAGLRGSSP